MSDLDDEATVETVEDQYYVDSPEEPSSFLDVFLERGSNLVLSPWFLLGLSFLAYYVYSGFLRDFISKWRLRREKARETEAIKKNPDLWKSRMESMEMARRRLQEEHEAAASLHASKRAQVEEEKRKKKVEEWDILKKGGSTKAANKPSEPDKPGYFPLMGAGDGPVCYRPNRRTGSGGGG